MSGSPLEQLGATIRQIRSKRGLTQLGAAEAAGLSVSYWSLIEQGKRTPTFMVLVKLAEALGVPATILVFLALDVTVIEQADQEAAERLSLLAWKLMSTGKEGGRMSG